VKKIVKKTPPARAAMTGAPGKYVIDYYYFVSVGLLAGRIPQGGPFFFGNVSVHSSIAAKRRLIRLTSTKDKAATAGPVQSRTVTEGA